MILTDDIGFGASATFGGLIPTPTLDRLAKAGVRYNQFHTAGLCPPTRASLLSGREPHNANMGVVTNIPTGYDGYTSIVPKSVGMIPEVLRQNGFVTAAFGKWHLTPDSETSAAGPFDRWPNRQGFDYYYGFLEGDADQFAPGLIENSRPVDGSKRTADYILDRDLADHAIGWIRQQQDLAPDRPFFAYYAPGSAHAPNSAPREWIDRFRGQFDRGWDVAREQISARQKALGVIPCKAVLT